MLSERMQIMIEYRDVLLEIIDLEDRIMGPEVVKEAIQKEPQKKPEEKPAKKAAVDKGKIIVLHQAGWSCRDIAEDVKCSESSVYYVLKEYKQNEGGEKNDTV